MKKLIMLTAILFAAFTAVNAQLQKGNVLVGGDIANFNFGLNSGGAVDINIQPSAAWFIKDNVALGAKVVLNPTFYSNGGGTDFRYAVDALGRYYINDPKVNPLKHGRWFLEGLFGIGGENYPHGGGSTNGLNLGFGPGYAYFITPNVGLETSLEYNGLLGFGNATTQSNLSLNVGFQIYLPGKATRDRIMNQEK